MDPAVSVTPESSPVEVMAGEQCSVRMRVRNSGVEMGYYRLGAAGVDPAWIKIEPEQLSVFPGEEDTAELHVHPPADSPTAAYRLSVLVLDQGGHARLAQAPLELKVRAAPGTGKAAAAGSGPRGGEAPATGQVTGGRTAGGPPPSNPAGPPKSSAPGAPGQGGPVPPAGGGFGVQAESAKGGQLEIEAESETVTLPDGGRKSVALRLRNHAGRSRPVSLAVQGVRPGWATITPQTLTLPARGAEGATLTLMPPAGAPTGIYRLVLTARGREDPGLSAQLVISLELAGPGQAHVELTPLSASGQAGASYQAQVSQASGAAVNFRLSAGGDSGCDYRFDPPTLLVPDGGEAISRLTVQARQGVSGGDSQARSFTVRATPLDGAGAPVEAPGRFVQQRTPPLQVSLDPPAASGAGPTGYHLQVVNPSQVPAVLRLAANGDPAAPCRYTFNPETIEVPAGGSAGAALTVEPLATVEDPGGAEHSFTVSIEPDGDLIAPTGVRGRFKQISAPPPLLFLSPSSPEGAGKINYHLQIKNPRSEQVELELRAGQVDHGLGVEIPRTVVRLPAGGAITIPVKVHPTEELLEGEQRRVNRFVIEAQAPDMARPAVVQGTLIQVGRSSIARALPWIVGLGILLIALAALWFWFGQDIVSALRGIVSPGSVPAAASSADAAATMQGEAASRAATAQAAGTQTAEAVGAGPDAATQPLPTPRAFQQVIFDPGAEAKPVTVPLSEKLTYGLQLQIKAGRMTASVTSGNARLWVLDTAGTIMGPPGSVATVDIPVDGVYTVVLQGNGLVKVNIAVPALGP